MNNFSQWQLTTNHTPEDGKQVITIVKGFPDPIIATLRENVWNIDDKDLQDLQIEKEDVLAWCDMPEIPPSLCQIIEDKEDIEID